MIKKLGLLALTTGMLFSGGVGVSAAETSQTLKVESFNQIKPLSESMAYTTIEYDSDIDSYIFRVEGLQSPFNKTYYQRVAWTDNSQEPNSRNIVTYDIAPKYNDDYCAESIEDASDMEAILSPREKVYGWAKAQNGNWYPAGFARF
ncbi:hypothetical protein [Bacillus siamensis]|uniref:hypothetical protein n=1 Tax=Bacillus siamensis TaxID=659243 RepID=UPI00036D8E03|nr:hypothetical protein [Bacillus siamensis]